MAVVETLWQLHTLTDISYGSPFELDHSPPINIHWGVSSHWTGFSIGMVERYLIALLHSTGVAGIGTEKGVQY